MTVSRRRRPTIGVLTGWQVYTGIIDSFLEHVIRGVQAAARARDANLLLACGASSITSFYTSRPGWPLVDERVDFLPVGPWNCDGLVVLPTLSVAACAQMCMDLAGEGYPVVFAGLQGLGCGVAPDNAMGIRQAMQHLYEHGHRRIAFLAGFAFDEQGDSGARLRAYRQALDEFGLPYDPALVAHGDHEVAGGARAMAEVLARGAPFTAVLASNDLVAIGALDILRQAGLQVPRDVALIGFDNRVETRGQDPPLTTVHLPMFELGYQALEMALDHLQGRVRPREIRRIPTDMVIRESCGCQPGQMGKISRRPGAFQPLLELGESGPTEQSLTPRSATRHGPGADHPLADRWAEQEITAIIQTEAHRLRRADVKLLTARCVQAFRRALAAGDPQLFLAEYQAILDQVSAWNSDLYIWQYAVTVLRDSPVLWRDACLPPGEVAAMLDRARVLASEAARAQHTRQIIRQAENAERLEVMTNRFFEPQDEDEVFNILDQSLPAVGIQQNAVLYYAPEGDDPHAVSVLPAPRGALASGARFSTYQFPPPGLFHGVDDSEQPYQLALLPLNIGGALTGYAAFSLGPLGPLADIVRQLGASLNALRLRQEAQAGQRLAEEANHLKGRFLSMVGHELRAPLNLIAGLSDIMMKEAAGGGDTAGGGETAGGDGNASEGEDRQTAGGPAGIPWDDLRRIYSSAQHLDSLIQDVLDLTLSDIGQLRLACEPLDLRDVLDYVVQISQVLIQDKGLAWRCEIEDDLPRVWGDRTRLRQVTLNLLSNAIKFTRQGEVTLTARRTAEGLVAVSVRDTGLGIPPGEQELIFQEFRQSERTAARGFGGLGLGLAICQRLVELHGGTIRVASSGEPDEGAEFTYTLLPVAAEGAGLVEHPLVLPAGLDAPERVLLLASDLAAGGEIERFLAEKGHQALLVPYGAEGGWLASLLAFDPALVIIDRQVSAEGGWDVLRTIKQNPAARHIPALFYGFSGDGQRGAFLELDYLTKPLKSAVLADALVQYQLVNQCDDPQQAPLVLVVDDDRHTVDLHARLVHAQFPTARVRKAYNGREALEIIRAEPPALVLLDLLMPEMDGFAVLNEMRSDRATQGIPVIVITSQNLDPHDIAKLNQGVVTILGKTIFSKDEMLQHIAGYLGAAQRRGAEAQHAILKAMGFIHANYRDPLTRGDIASSVGMSERHLDRCFQRGLGISPITYLNRYRVFQARQLLEARQGGITAVALEVGFSSSGYFARVFRAETGLSPRAYLQASQKQDRPG